MNKKIFFPSRNCMEITTGEIVRILREKKQWTQAELARQSGLTNNNISLIEHDRVEIGKHRALALAQALGVHPATILFPNYELGSVKKAA
jgi:transcriptional regulator with XRE-family HTH domain